MPRALFDLQLRRVFQDDFGPAFVELNLAGHRDGRALERIHVRKPAGVVAQNRGPENGLRVAAAKRYENLAPGCDVVHLADDALDRHRLTGVPARIGRRDL
jgi:hypothetical protein